VLREGAGWPEYEAVLAMPSSGLRWNDHFMLLARAVLLGRAGRGAEAAAAVERAGEVGSVYAMARHLGLRLAGEAALEDGWGAPVGWLRTAEEYFHQLNVPAVASACRALLRRSGTLVPQRRDGVDRVPAELRSLGVTVREYEILLLVVDRLGNRLIGERLGISPRTVEKHVASLITKTGQPHRNALSEHAARILAT
jgi:DNA-binding CsgD family transcriptional regulator